MTDETIPHVFPPLPAPDATLAPTLADRPAAAWLAHRRSTPIAQLSDPGPSETVLREILAVAVRIPDHGKLAPWRLVVITGDRRQVLGAAYAAFLAGRAALSETESRSIERTFSRAPAVVMVVSAPVDHPKIPLWEQQLSAGALCYNVCLAAQIAGFGAAWLTEPLSYDLAALAALFGLKAHERVAGFVHIGTPVGEVKERERPNAFARIEFI